MTAAPKRKVSLTLSADVVRLVDRHARRGHTTRSGVVEDWLRRTAGAAVEREIEHATVAYYQSLRCAEGDVAAGEDSLSRALSDAARRVAYDDPAPSRRRAGH